MPTSFDTSFSTGDLIEDFQVNQFASPVNGLETGSSYFAVDTGSSDAYAITMTPAPGAYTAGMCLSFQATSSNSGAATLNVNALGAIALKQNGNQDLRTGSIVAGQIVSVVYDGTYFQLAAAGAPLASNLPTGIDVANLADGSVTNAEFEALDGVTSNIQTQISAKPDSLAELADVTVGTPSAGEVLSWSEASSVWKPSPNALGSFFVGVSPVLYFSGIVKYDTVAMTTTPLYPDGSGDLDLDVETDIVYRAVGDTFCRNFTLESGATLQPYGYRIAATLSITIDGEIDMSGATLNANPATGALPAGNNSTGFFIGGQGGAGGAGDTYAGVDPSSLYFNSALLSNLSTYLLNYPADGFTLAGQAGGIGGLGGLEVATPGAAGQGGGTIMLISPQILGSGTLNVAGQNGGDMSGFTMGDDPGGGGGGGGGAIVLVGASISGSLTNNVSGGYGGSGFTGGADGSSGTVYTVPLVA